MYKIRIGGVRCLEAGQGRPFRVTFLEACSHVNVSHAHCSLTVFFSMDSNLSYRLRKCFAGLKNAQEGPRRQRSVHP